MRKLKLQMQLSVDSFIARPDGGLDWMQWNWDQELKDYVKELTDPVDCILLGRKLAEGFIPVWETRLANPGSPEEEAAARKFVETHKIVFTETLENTDPAIHGWKNTEIAKGNFAQVIRKLKKGPGGDLIAYGGSRFVASLIRESLIDDFHFFVNPAAIGEGMGIFHEVSGRLNLQLVTARPFACGVVVLHYRPA